MFLCFPQSFRPNFGFNAFEMLACSFETFAWCNDLDLLINYTISTSSEYGVTGTVFTYLPEMPEK